MIDNFPHTPEDKLEEALALLAAGLPLDEILAGFNSDAAWLEPLLETAIEVSDLPQGLPIPAPDLSLQRMLDHAAHLRPGPSPVTQTRPFFSKLLPRWPSARGIPAFGLGMVALLSVAGFIALLLFSGLVVGGTALVAQNSLPGQRLYQVKQLTETVNLSLTRDPSARSRLLGDYNERRQEEVRQLLAQGEQVEVTFEGEVEELADTMLTIDGFETRLTSSTDVVGTAQPGARVRLIAMTRPPNRLVALSLLVIEPALPTSTPSPSLTPTLTLTPTPVETTVAPISPTAIPQTSLPPPVTASPVLTVTGTATPRLSITPTDTTAVSETPIPTVVTTIEGSPPSSTITPVTPQPTPTNKGSATLVPTPTSTEAPTVAPSKTATPTSTSTKAATALPTPTPTKPPTPIPPTASATPTIEPTPDPTPEPSPTEDNSGSGPNDDDDDDDNSGSGNSGSGSGDDGDSERKGSNSGSG